MADLSPAGDPGKCDTKDRGVTPARLEVLKNEAHAFNEFLRVTEGTPSKTRNKATIQQDEKDFYSYLPGHHDLTGDSFDAAKAFWEQVTELPIGERRQLLALTQAENDEIRKTNSKMPHMVLNMDSSAFINSLNFEMTNGYEYTFGARGMCAEIPDFDPNQNYQQRGWGFDLPTLNLRR
ncbi:MAG TPA: hypothetical protein V6C81_32430 [Planktothrix sp.]